MLIKPTIGNELSWVLGFFGIFILSHNYKILEIPSKVLDIVVTMEKPPSPNSEVKVSTSEDIGVMQNEKAVSSNYSNHQ
jgi:hypothetical protein